MVIAKRFALHANVQNEKEIFIAAIFYILDIHISEVDFIQKN